MDRRVKERRRLVKRERGRRRAGLIFLGVLVVVAAVLFLWLRSSTVFAVEKVSAPPTRHVTQEQIAQAVSSARGESLLKVSTSSIEKKLEALPYVRSVHVYRAFPHGLDIRLQEYEPLARVRTGDGRIWLVADDGRVLESIGAETDPTLLLVLPAATFTPEPGSDVPQTVASTLGVAKLLQSADVASLLPAVEQVSVSAGGEVVVRLQGGTEIRLGEPTDLKQKIMVAAGIIQQHLRDGKALQYVDASAPDRVAVKAE